MGEGSSRGGGVKKKNPIGEASGDVARLAPLDSSVLRLAAAGHEATFGAKSYFPHLWRHLPPNVSRFILPTRFL